jgi:hypothetical protein
LREGESNLFLKALALFLFHPLKRASQSLAGSAKKSLRD